MPDKDSIKYKHLTEEERLEIQQCLNHGMTFKAIGKRIYKDQTTISKEIKKHLETRGSEVKRLNEDGTEAGRVISPTLLKSPFVCNPCEKRHFITQGTSLIFQGYVHCVTTVKLILGIYGKSNFQSGAARL